MLTYVNIYYTSIKVKKPLQVYTEKYTAYTVHTAVYIYIYISTAHTAAPYRCRDEPQ